MRFAVVALAVGTPIGALSTQTPRPTLELTPFVVGYQPIMPYTEGPLVDVRQTTGFGGGGHLSWRFARSYLLQGSLFLVRTDVARMGEEQQPSTVQFADLRVVRASVYNGWHASLGIGGVSRSGAAWEEDPEGRRLRRSVSLGIGTRFRRESRFPIELGGEMHWYNIESEGDSTLQHDLVFRLGLPIALYRGRTPGPS